MRHAGIAAATLALALALAGCASEEERAEAGKASLRATLEAAGYTQVKVGKASGDGVSSVSVADVSAKGPDGLSVAVKKAVFRSPDVSPMLVRWHDFGPVEIGGWQLYGGHAPKPKGLRAESLVLEGVQASFDSMPVAVTVDRAVLEGWDSAARLAGRYDRHRAEGVKLSLWGEELVTLSEASGSASGWIKAVDWPLDTGLAASGTLTLPARLQGIMPEALKGPFDFNVESSSKLDPQTGAWTGSLSGVVDGIADFSYEAGLDGLVPEVLVVLARASRGGKGAPSAEEAVAAASKIRMTGMKLEAEGLEWLGPVLDAYGGREAWVNLAIPAIDSGYEGKERSAETDAFLAEVALFLRDPSSFRLEFVPPGDFAPAEKTAEWYSDPASAPFETLGFRFDSRPEGGRRE